MANLTRNTGTGLPFKLYQDTRKSSANKGKWYAKAKAAGVMDLDALAEHIASHGSTFTKADIAGVLYTMQDCILELLLSGQRVRLGDLGTFYLAIRSTASDTKDSFSVAENIKGVHLRFTPNQADDAGLTSTRLREVTKFINLADMAGVADEEESGGE